MDKKPIIGFILIGIILFAWMFYTSVNERPVPPPESGAESAQVSGSDTGTERNSAAGAEARERHPERERDYGPLFEPHRSGRQEILTVENTFYTIKLNSIGGVFKEWYLNHYDTWNGAPVQLIPWNDQPGVFHLTFSNRSVDKIDTRTLYFDLDYPTEFREGRHIKLGAQDSVQVTARLALANGSSLEKIYTFYGNSHAVHARLRLNGLDTVIYNRSVGIHWESGLRYQEKNSVEESSFAQAIASLNGEISSIDASDPEEDVEEKNTGLIEYSAIKNKYFVAALLPQDISTESIITLQGSARKAGKKGDGLVESYAMSYRVPYRQTSQEYNFRIFAGPLDYDTVAVYGLQETVDFGWEWLVRPIGEYFMLPVFQAVHSVIPNYGFAIIIFAILIKILLYPLSIQQIRSAAKMQVLAPEMNRLREKNKDDPAAQQKALMKMYSEYGVNPASGCLPLLLQMPILYALWSLFRSVIDLRQTEFFGWIDDLSVPDVMVDLGFKIPLFGIQEISGLALVMGISMFIQQKMTITDPRQKGMIYIMPVMFTLLFSNFPAGLNLYYLTFNFLGIFQQLYMTKFSKNKITLEDLKSAPKKEGWMARKMREAQQIAEAQGRSLPGQAYNDHNPNKRKRKKKSRR